MYTISDDTKQLGLKQVPRRIIEQHQRFQAFIDRLADIELLDIPFDDDFFEEAKHAMPLFSSKIENLHKNLSALESNGKISIMCLLTLLKKATG